MGTGGTESGVQLAFRVLSDTQAQKEDADVPAQAENPAIPAKRYLRRIALSRPDQAFLNKASAGSLLGLPLLDGVQAVGRVILNRGATSQDPAAISGQLEQPFPGSFALVEDPRLGWRGMILPASGNLAYELEEDPKGQLFLYEMLRGDVVCSPMLRHPDFVPAPSSLPPLPPIPPGGFSSARAKAAWLAAVNSNQKTQGMDRETGPVPQLRSRPNARGVLYLDFDGATVTDPFWADGRTINALPSGFSTAQMTDLWKVISEDFAPFWVNVSTVEADYNSAPQGLRMRCIFTPTTDAAPSAGGVAYLSSFRWSGTTPCWAFNGTGSSAAKATAVHVAAMTGSHELGHTFSLRHDGQLPDPIGSFSGYYAGHGTGATSWGPIMGAPFTREVIQWSKGDYKDANNKEDDVALISSAVFGIGYVPDDYADSIASAGAIPQSSKGVVFVSGLIQAASDRDLFRLDTGKGTLSISGVGAAPEANLDVKLELLNSAGTVIATADPAGTLAASLSYNAPAEGVYYLRVSSGAEPDGSSTGWTTYGSIGAYTLTGNFPSLVGYADNFSAAASLGSRTTFSGVGGSTVSATAETGEPNHAGSAAAKSIWWKWTAPGNGWMRLDTKGSSFPTRLAVYTGNSLSTLQALASGAQVHRYFNHSQVDFAYARGTSYFIAVDGVQGASGSVVLNGSGVQPQGPANDAFISATTLTGSTVRVRDNNINATREEGEPQHFMQNSGGTLPYSGFCSVWYRWVAPASGSYVLSTEGSTFDTLLGVYTGEEISSLVKVAANDNATSSVRWSRARFTATAGTTYFFAVDGVGSVGGAYQLLLNSQP